MNKIEKQQEAFKQSLVEKGLSEEEIMDIMKNTEIKLTGRTDLDPNLKSLKETVEILQKRLGGFWNERKIHRIIKKGELTPIDFNVPKRFGYQLKMEDIEEYIRLQSLTTEDWKNNYYDLLQKYEELKYQLEENQGKGTTELHEKIQELESKVDELQHENKNLQDNNLVLVNSYNKDMGFVNEKNEEIEKENKSMKRQLKHLQEDHEQLQKQNEKLINDYNEISERPSMEEFNHLFQEKKDLTETVQEFDEVITKQRAENEKKDRKIKRLEKKVKDLEAKEVPVE
ncbi:hypothetical protein [Bacillus cereus]|uniref:hypothetical protein n=1 Tax=Bacillus cereus TaxID=1396 RepID=UPI000BECFB28|nr:hypothetical protein [Bacillus cereus]PDY82745.1 hypothetical protein CON06_10085 [Bacillus cereus]